MTDRGEIIIYRNEDNHVSLNVRLEDEKNIVEKNRQNKVMVMNEQEFRELLNYNMNFNFDNSDTMYLTHSLHSYPAKFPPQLPHTIIKTVCTQNWNFTF